jgi:hypothetical protein
MARWLDILTCLAFARVPVSGNDLIPKNGRCKMIDLPQHIVMKEFFTTIELIRKALFCRICIV